MKDKLTNKERLYIKTILSARANNPVIGYAEIARELGITKQTLDKVIKNAEDKGFVERMPSYLKVLKDIEK